MRVPRFGAPLAALGVLLWLAPAGVDSQETAERFWPQWRGPHATGVSRHADPPLEWSETRNIRWKVEIPGRGSCSRGRGVGPLQDLQVFDAVELDPTFGTIQWPNGAAFDPETLHDWPKYRDEFVAMATRWAADPARRAG